MANAAMMPLADKLDGIAPYFAIVLVPGWEQRPLSGRLTIVGLGPGDAALSDAGGAPTPRGSRCALRLRALSRPRAAARGPDAASVRQPRRRARAPKRRSGRRRPGAHVAMVSGGDPGVFAMAAAVCGEIDAGPAEWRAIDVVVVPGITAMLAVAARVGAPLGHDFCAISLSDNLKPWDVIERRLDAAAAARLRHRALQPDLEGAALAARRGLRAAVAASCAVDAGRVRPRGRAGRTRR